MSIRPVAPSLSPGVNPAQHMRTVLEECKLAGIPFEDAWEMGLRSLPRGSCPESKKYVRGWKAVLRWAKPAFHDAYETGLVPSDGGTMVVGAVS